MRHRNLDLLPAASRGIRRLLVAMVALVAVATGFTAWRRRRRHRSGDFRVFILEYHDVGRGSREPEGTVSAARLRRHLRYLKGRYRFTTVAEAAELLRSPAGLDADYVAITFDDGYLSNYEVAWPILREEQVPATVYACTGFLDGEELWFDFARRALHALERRELELPPDARAELAGALGDPARSLEVGELRHLSPERLHSLLEALRGLDLELEEPAQPMSWDQACTLQAAGIEIGAHTVHHPSLATLPKEAQAEEIALSRERICEKLGSAPPSFAVPHGSRRDFDATTVDLVRSAGFEAACTTVRGSNRPGCDLYQLRRIGIGSDSNAVLDARLSGLFDEEARRWLRWR